MNNQHSVIFSALRCLAVTGALAITAAIPSAAQVTFAQYTEAGGGGNTWSINTTAGLATTVTETGSVNFYFEGIGALPFGGLTQLATFTLTATSSQIGNCGTSCANNDSYTQPGYSGTFSFIDTALGTNLLSGTFGTTSPISTTGAQLGSTVGGGGGSFDASTDGSNPAQVVFTSDYLNLTGQSRESASWSLSSLIPSFAVDPNNQVTVGSSTQAYPSIGSYTAAGSGTFSSTPGPVSTPEPTTLALAGAALLALTRLRRRKTVGL